METYIAKKEGDKLYLFKKGEKVGEISPEAIWVKEGDEFEETDIQVLFIKGDNVGKTFTFSQGRAFYGNSPQKAPIRILIKGPCGHYH